MEHLTPEQQEAVDALVSQGSIRKAANALGLPFSTFRGRVERAQERGWVRPTAPVGVPEGMTSYKTTVQYDAKGNVLQEWRRLQPEAIFAKEFVKSLVAQVKGKGKVPKPKKKTEPSLMAEICAYDLHFGMYASAAETGDADYDTNIARDRLIAAVDNLVARLHSPKVIRLVLGGDQLHADNNKAQTPHSGHVLDVDTRYGLVIKKLIGATKDAVELAAATGATVEIYVVSGNHDPHSSLWLSEVLKAYYSNCPKIKVCSQMTPRKYAVWGECLSVYGHGDRVKADKWAGIVAAERRDLWGITKYRYARLGHIHTKRVIAPIVVDEAMGLETTFLSSLAASDAWHSESGYVGNNRGMQAFELDKNQGQIAQYYYNV